MEAADGVGRDAGVFDRVGITGVDGRRVECEEVHHDLRAERLDQLHRRLQRRAVVDVGREGDVLEVFGADADDDVLAVVVAERRPGDEQRLGATLSDWLPSLTVRRPTEPSRLT